MEFKELKNKSAGELQKLLVDQRNNLRELKFKVASDQLKNVRTVRVARKIIARILFLLNQKKIAPIQNRPQDQAEAKSDK